MSAEWLVICCVVIATLFGALLIRQCLYLGTPYRRREKFLSDCELSFYKVLLLSNPPGVVVVKPRLADLFEVEDQGFNFWKAFKKISQKHVDFLICDPETMTPLVGVELDDKSHFRPSNGISLSKGFSR